MLHFFSKKQKYEQRAQLILMLILRALLYIKREFEIDEKIEEQFLEKLKSFRKKSLDELTNLKLKYCIDFENILFEQNDSNSLDLNNLIKYIAPFFEDIKEINIEKDLQNKMTKYLTKNVNWHY